MCVHDSHISDLCFSAAQLICADLINIKDLKAIDWHCWFANAKKSASLVETYVLTQSSSIMPQALAHFKSLWQNVTVTKMFIEHICQHNDKFYTRCITLWARLSDAVDFKRQETFAKFVIV